MKMLIYFLIALTTSSISAQSQDTLTLNITIDNVVNNDGTVQFALYVEDNFMKGSPTKSKIVKIKDKIASVSFNDLPQGNYSVIAFHDMNANGRMDFEPTGMPKEDYSTSGDANTFGPPTWSDSNFKLTENRTLVLRF